MKASEFFTLPASLALFAEHFKADAAPWEWVKRIEAALKAAGFGEKVYVHPTAKVAPSATLAGPAWIGPRTEIRPGAYIRANVIVGEGCVLGNSCEFKNALLMDKVQVPHFSYVGDSVLGSGAHLAAGAICSNLRLDQGPIVVRTDSVAFETKMKKLGAIIGEGAEVGCNAVLNPGTVLGKRALVAPAMSFAGYLPAGMIAKVRQSVTLIARKD